MLVTDPAAFVIPPTASHALGREYWIWRDDGGALQAAWAVNNCVMQFTAASTLLDFYIDSCQTAVRAAARIDRRIVGPTLLTALNAAVPLPLVSALATLSPTLIDAVARGEQAAVDFHTAAWGTPVHAVHFCRSVVAGSGGMALIDEATVDAAIDRLLAEPGLLDGRAEPAIRPAAPSGS